MENQALVTLEDMLKARDKRQAYQRLLLERNPEATLIIFTVVAPGKEKHNRNTAIIAEAGCKALREMLHVDILFWEEKDLPTGFELWILTGLTPSRAKHKTVFVEETHPLGRLMDIDVIGANLKPVSRTELNLPSRRCLICDNDARVCMRIGSHTYGELLQTISERVEQYVTSV